MNLKKCLSAVCAFAILATALAGCGKNDEKVKNNSFDTEAVSNSFKEEIIAENDNYSLGFNSVSKGVTITDKLTGKVYGTNPMEEGGVQFDELGMPVKRHPQLESVLFIKFLDTVKNTTGEAISYTSAVKNGRTAFEKTENGIKINYYFDDAEIMIPVTYTLREKGIALSINPKEIQENDKMLLSVSVAPFFCSSKNTEENGYLLYPSGSGALIYPKEISQPGETYSAEIYGADASKEVWDKVSTEKDIRLPVLGAKFGEQAVFGIIEEGAESSLLNLKVGSTSIGYSSIYVTYQVRGFTANIKELYNNRFYKGEVYSDNMIDAPLTVCYYPLEGEKANYSSMAEVYRNYLDKTAGKKETKKVSTVDISVVGGTMIQKSFVGIPYKTLFTTATVDDASKIVTELKNDGVMVSNLTLSGFGENGIDSNKLGGGFKLDSKLGKAKQLKALQKTCTDDGVDLFFDFDVVGFTETANGYNSYFDAATRANKKVAKLYNFDVAVLGRNTENSYSILKRDRLADAVEDAYKAANKWGVGGVGFSTLSSIAYSDYSDKENSKYYSKAGIATQVSEILTKNDKIKLMSNDANAYAAGVSDLNLNIPTFSSNVYLFDEDIPFYAMALRGRTAISGEALNLVTDAKAQVLRSVESGAGIAYTLTNDYSTKLLDSTSSVFYNSLYKDLKDDIKSVYNNVSEYYEKIGNSKIKSHKIHENGLRETVFENGVSVFVNYSETELSCEAGTVSAESFLVWEANV